MKALSFFSLSVCISLVSVSAADEDFKEQIEAFESKYALKLVLKGHNFTPELDGISGDDADNVETYLPLLLSEFNLYPPEFVKKSGVVKIVLCKKLAYKNQFRAAIPGLGTGILYYDVENGAGIESYQRSTMHHEYFHLVDYRDDGRLYKDDNWARLNPDGFSYGRGGQFVQDDPTQSLTSNRPGFMNKYSTQGVEEDKAEVFAYLVTQSELMEQRVKDDPIIASKVNMMRQLLTSFSPAMNHEFWQKSAALKRGRTAVDILTDNARALLPLVKSDVCQSFLAAAPHMPKVPRYVLYYEVDAPNAKSLRGLEGITEQQLLKLDKADREKYKPVSVTDTRYYLTRYGTPIAFARALDLCGQAGLNSLESKKIVDFGFGSIGHLRMMASCGANVFGIEVDTSLRGLYSSPRDQGKISRFGEESGRAPGKLRLLFGNFPGEDRLTSDLGSGIDVFFSKNTLKRGYIHPEQEVPESQKISLGVSDAEFIKSVFDRLNPGGMFMIYNLHPKRTAPGDGYIPWSDGRSPFEKGALESAGFKVIQFDCDDTAFSHEMAKRFGWDKSMDVENNLRATYTLLQKPQ